MERPNEQPGFAQSMGWLVFLCRAVAVTVEVFLHGRFGERYLGINALVGMAIVILITGLWPGADAAPLLYFLAAFLGMLFFARCGVLYRHVRGDAWHSYYSGRPRLLALLPRLDEPAVKAFLEPVLVLGAGLLVMPMSEPLGSYLVVAAIALAVSVNFTLAGERQRAMDLRDAQIEQRELLERLRRPDRKRRF